MPRRKPPGPKSKTQKPSQKATTPQKQRVASFLGDSSANETSNDESFGVPELEGDYTDYNLEYTISPGSQKRSKQQPESIPTTPRSRINKKQTSTKEQSQRKTSKATTRPSLVSEKSRGEAIQSKSNKSKTTSNSKTNFLSREKSRKQKSPLSREAIMWKQIKQLQARTDNLTPKLPFGRLIRELLLACNSEATRITAPALEALQLSAELYLTQLFSDSYVCTLHRGRVTLGVHDIRLVRYLRGVSDRGNM